MTYSLIEIDNHNHVIVMNTILTSFSMSWSLMYLSREISRGLGDMSNKRKNEMNPDRYTHIFLNILVIQLPTGCTNHHWPWLYISYFVLPAWFLFCILCLNLAVHVTDFPLSGGVFITKLLIVKIYYKMHQFQYFVYVKQLIIAY